ncbi:MAG TPA: hypothetical protein PK156_47665, partial [Polyangium sp.]|nr:hypothetical protein [Polyangium sp.]
GSSIDAFPDVLDWREKRKPLGDHPGGFRFVGGNRDGLLFFAGLRIVTRMAASSGPLHRLCLDSWELLQTFRGSTIPREGETVRLEKDGKEMTYVVTRVRYKLEASGEMIASVFVKPAV